MLNRKDNSDEGKRQQKSEPSLHLSHQKLMIGLEYLNAKASYIPARVFFGNPKKLIEFYCAKLRI